MKIKQFGCKMRIYMVTFLNNNLKDHYFHQQVQFMNFLQKNYH